MTAVNENLFKTIDELLVGLPLSGSVRAQNGIRSVGVKYVGELVQLNESNILRTRNFGRKALGQVKRLLATMDLTFGMQVDNWPFMLAARLAARTGSPVTLTAEAMELLFGPIEELKLPARCEYHLKYAGIRYVGELLQATEAELIKSNPGPGLTIRSLKEVKTKLAELDPEFVLGMKIRDWDELLARYEVRVLEDPDDYELLETENAVLRGKNELLERLLRESMAGQSRQGGLVAARSRNGARELLREWAESEQVVRTGNVGEEVCRCCEMRGTRVKPIEHYGSCRWIRTRAYLGMTTNRHSGPGST